MSGISTAVLQACSLPPHLYEGNDTITALMAATQARALGQLANITARLPLGDAAVARQVSTLLVLVTRHCPANASATTAQANPGVALNVLAALLAAMGPSTFSGSTTGVQAHSQPTLPPAVASAMLTATANLVTVQHPGSADFSYGERETVIVRQILAASLASSLAG